MPVYFEDQQMEARYYEDTRYLFLWDWEIASMKGEESKLEIWKIWEGEALPEEPSWEGEQSPALL